MTRIIHFFRRQPINFLLLAAPIAILASADHWGEIWVFVASSLAIIPIARYIGAATEALAHYTGPRVGALLNATLGNAAELIITIFAIQAGLLDLVKASITGSILGNLLLVLGMAMLLGGIKNGLQRFQREPAMRNAVLLALSVITLLIPSILSSSIGPSGSLKVEILSLGVATVMIVLYALTLIYSFSTQNGSLTTQIGETELVEAGILVEENTRPPWSVRTALVVLILATIGVAVMSELLVGAVEPIVIQFGITEFFLGIILIPIIGNAAEHLVAVTVAIRNKMDLSVEISVSSSLQIALFVAPLLVFISLLMGHPLTLVFNQFEWLALIAGVMIAALVSFDGESNWLEGAELLAIYLILALAFFLLPA